MKNTLQTKSPIVQVGGSRSIESNAINLSIIVGFIAFGLALLLIMGESLPLFGRRSIGIIAAMFATIAALVVFVLGWQQKQAAAIRSGEKEKPSSSLTHKLRMVVKVGSLAFIYAAICFLLYAAVFAIVQRAFQGVLLDMWSSSAIIGASVGVATYAIYYVAVRMTPSQLSMALALFLISGVLTSAIAVEDPYWWQYHFSSLGSGDTASAAVFNMTLIIAGLVIVAIADYIIEDLRIIEGLKEHEWTKQLRIIWWMLATIGVMLALVGAFVYNVNPVIHNSAAGGMAIAFLGLIIALPFLVKGFSNSFYTLSYGMLGFLLFCLWLYKGREYFNLTTFELMAAGIIFSWLVVFIRQIASVYEDRVAHQQEQRQALKSSSRKSTAV